MKKEKSVLMFDYKRSIVLLLIAVLSVSYTKLLQADDFYWKNGSGNWSDTLHWNSATGGLPDSTDNVFFNKDSFSSPGSKLIIDINARCRNFNWDGADYFPVVAGDSTLSVYGSMTLIPEMSFNFTGDIYFISDEPENEITAGSNVLHSGIFFQGSGSWYLMDSLIVPNNIIRLESGTLFTNDNYLECLSFYSNSAGNRSLNSGNSVIRIKNDWIVDQSLQFTETGSRIVISNSDENAIVDFEGGGLAYHNVILKNSANISGGNSFENLYLSAGKTYIFESGKTQTLFGELHARGCAGMITIKASGTGKAIFKKSNGDINVSYVNLHSIKHDTEEGYQFNAFRSVDGGNNTGCNFIADSRDMHWINGGGHWSDTTHWDSYPAGPDADCLPVMYDNVYFDNNSFDGADTVKVYNGKLMCNDMIWTTNENAVFESEISDPELHIFGSLKFSDAMVNEFAGDVFFRDSLGGKQIRTAGKGLNGNVRFSGNGGEWELLDSLGIYGNLSFLSGTLKTNGNPLSCSTFHSDTASVRSFEFENSGILINGSSPYPAWSLNDSNLIVKADGSTITFVKNSSTMYTYGGDTVKYHDVIFNGTLGSVRLDTEDDTYCSFGRVSFGSNALIYGNNSYDTISLTPGNYYSLEAGKTQTIGSIRPTGTCEGPVLLESSVNGSQATIKTTDSLIVEHTSIRDINASGDAYYAAYQSVDIGNNTGWDTIAENIARKLYWVGGTGNWSDSQHWSSASGDTGGECIPTPVDTVIFDINSFQDTTQIVTVDQNNAFVHNFVWENINGKNPEFSGSYAGSYLRIYGSMVLDSNLKFTFPGYIWFEARDTGQIVKTDGIKFHNVNNDVHFDGIGGEWTLIDALDLGKSVANKNIIYFYNGRLNTNGQLLKAYSFYSTTSTDRTLNLDTSSVVVNDRWYVYGTNLQLNQNQSVIQVDSGNFMHYYGEKANYNDLTLNSGTQYQKVLISTADSVIFNNVLFNNSGEISGSGSYVIASKVDFLEDGKINTAYNSSVNIFNIDSLIFNGTGYLMGDDTAGYVLFDSVANIQGNGFYGNTLMNNDGDVYGNNIFDTLTFSPGFTYKIEGGNTQTINKEFNIKGNNCQSVWFQSTSAEKAIIQKDTGFVSGDFIEMQNIKAGGGALFDAGNFSTDINSSNEGWIFHDFPEYSLGNDTLLSEGETLYLCAKNFNGNEGTLYEWKDCNTGEIIGQDSCVTISDGGEYCLTVFYDDGPGCQKSDTIKIGCFFDLDMTAKNVTCNGFANGEISTDVINGTSPLTVIWYKDDQFYDTTLNLTSLSPGNYMVSLSDSKGCFASDSVIITQPDSLHYDADVNDACFGEENGMITLAITGGTEPYFVNWSDGQDDVVAVNLAAGQYQVVVTDTNNCPSPVGSFTVDQLPAITFGLNGTDLLCYGDGSGSADAVNLSGGTGVYEHFDWYLDGQLYDTSQSLTQAQSGKYILKVTDDYGCHSFDSVYISQPDSLSLHLEAEAGTIELGAINLTVEGGTEPYSYLWTNGATTQNIDPLGGGVYHVWVTDNNGCKSTDSIFVEVHYRILAPTGFSPNGDGTNDYFRIRGLGTDLTEFSMLIFNRWGEVVFKTDNVKEYWNGKKFNVGVPMPEDTYLWQASLEYTSGVKITDKGNVTLLR